MILMMFLQFQLLIIFSFKTEWEKYNFIMLYLNIFQYVTVSLTYLYLHIRTQKIIQENE
jgi:hypothetical protein